MQRSNMEDSGGWKRYWYEQADVRQAAQTSRSPSGIVSQPPTIRQCCRPAGALQVVMPSILSHRESPGLGVRGRIGPTTDRDGPSGDLIHFTESVPEPGSRNGDRPVSPTTCEVSVRTRWPLRDVQPSIDSHDDLLPKAGKIVLFIAAAAVIVYINLGSIW
ncbi:hypothetical protein GCM10020367_69270 [Streptomyces sannanensis]|uniref:Uncharacterized protein n=1 Tax=Streptomyces sannanensis TaxID=285536 RepID=A0ABP6SMD7_9ACTN